MLVFGVLGKGRMGLILEWLTHNMSMQKRLRRFGGSFLDRD